MKYSNTIFIFLLFAYFTCQGQEEKYNRKFSISNPLGLDAFLLLTSDEKKMDSLFKKNDKLVEYGPYINNRSRIYVSIFRNGVPEYVDTSSVKRQASAECMCYINNDTITIKTWIGFFVAIGFTIKLHKDEFTSKYIIQVDQPDTFKTSLNDKNFTGSAVVDSKFQKLHLTSIPSFKPNEQITGFLEIVSNDFYEKRSKDNIDTISVIGSVFFTCKTRMMTIKDMFLQQ